MSRRWASASPQGVTVIAGDIIERRHVEESLQQELEKAQRCLDIVGTMVVAIDADQRVSLINQAGCRLLGCGEAEILGKNWFDHFLPKPVREHVRRVYSSSSCRGLSSRRAVPRISY